MKVMSYQFKKLFFSLIYNSSILLFLMIGIQNSSSQKKVYLMSYETIRLPVSFIIGLSYLSGSITGSFMNINFLKKKDDSL